MTGGAITRLKQRLSHLIAGDNLKASLIRAGLGSAGIQAAERVLSLALGIVLARTLGAEGYGVYAYAFAIMTLLMVLAEAGVPTLLMREIAASHGREDWGLLRGVVRRAGQFVTLAASTVSIVGLLILWGIGESLSTAMFYTTALMLLVLPLSAGAKTITHALFGLSQVILGQALNMLLRPLLVLGLIAVTFLVWPELQTPQYAMAAQLGAALVVVLSGLTLYWVIAPATVRTTRPIYRTPEWLRSALPFTLIGGAGVINNHTDIIMLGWFSSSEDVGIYRVSSQGALLVTLGLQVVGSVLAPHFSRLYHAGNNDQLKTLYRRSRSVVLVFSFPVALIFVVFGDLLLRFVFGADYVSGAILLAILSVGFLVNVSFGPIGTLLQMTAEESFTAKSLWVSSVANIGLNLCLIPVYGALGAAIATAITLALYHVSLRIHAWRVLGI